MNRLALLIPLAALEACATTTAGGDPQDRFFAALSDLCGRSYQGRVVSPPVEADRAFAGKALVMQVRHCGADEIRIPFRVGDDRSRTWVIARRGGNLSLSHDHRHDDGSEDRMSRYGGSAVDEGTAARQEFPADAYSRELFTRENIPQSVANVWAMEVHPARIFAYELRRPGRFFRVEFDLARPLAGPQG